MDVRSFAEMILFGQTLEDKLVSPAALVDSARGSALLKGAVRWPGRPGELSLQTWHNRPRVSFPQGSALESETGRGRALHFFANHEILALELMALALLRFPEAPTAFRRGLVATMREEQDHMRLYMSRMNALGVGFGEIPVNDFFWQAISDMDSPHDFVVRMSLTFEQANLDFALAYMAAFARTGDTETAALMRRVYDDEVGHVRHGLAWHRQWKDPGDTDWAAFVRALPEALSPTRAKGASYSEEARRAAGFDDAYVRSLALFTRSKGRPPRVWTFWPTVEMDWAAEESGRATRGEASLAVRDLAHDFAWAPSFVAAHDDIVLVESAPGAEFLADLRTCGFALPEAVTLKDRARGALANRKLGGLAPWGWSGAVAKEFADVARASVVPAQDLGAIARALSLKTRVGAFEDALATLPSLAPLFSLCDRGFHAPIVVGSVAECEDALASPALAASHRFVLKAALSSSGRERVFLSRAQGVCPKARTWMERRFAAGERLSFEPFLDRVADLSVQFTVLKDARVKVHGISRFATDAAGRYLGAALGRKASGLPTDVVRFFYANPAGIDLLRALAFLGEEVGALCAAEGFLGHGGFDLFLYRHPTRGLALRPLVDLNPRLTMGRVALELERRIVPHAVGTWLHLGLADARVAGCESMGDFALRLRAAFGFSILAPGAHPPLLEAGALCTNDPATARRFLGVVLAARTPAALQESALKVSESLAQRVSALFLGAS